MTLPLLKDFYFIVKTYLITLSDIEDIFFKGNYPNLLSDLAERNYQLYIVSTYGIDKSATNFINQMQQVYYLHVEDLILQSSELLLESEIARTQIIKHILPLYSYLLTRNWRELVNGAKELSPSLTPEVDASLLYTNKLPLGVWVANGQIRPYKARFQYQGVIYNLGSYICPIEAGHVVKTKMLEIKGSYELPKGRSKGTPKLLSISA